MALVCYPEQQKLLTWLDYLILSSKEFIIKIMTRELKEEQRVKQKWSTLLRMRPNSLDLNSLRADFWRRSMTSSPLRSTTSSLICSVVICLISFNSSVLLDIITTGTEALHFVGGMEHVAERRSWMPLNGFGRKEMVEEEGEATERLNILHALSLSLSLFSSLITSEVDTECCR